MALGVAGGTNPLILQDAGGDVGIGTTPRNTLEVGSGALGAFAGKGLVVSNTSGNSHVDLGQGPSNRGRLLWQYNATPSNGYMALGVAGGSNPLVLQDAGGNLGIGTTSPGSKLDVAGNINFSGALSYQGTPILQVPGGEFNFSTAVGLSALGSNTAEYYNTATGAAALFSNTTGSENVAMGLDALYSNTTGIDNIAIGYQAGLNVVTGYGNIYIGSSGPSDESGTIRIGLPGTQGSFFAAGIFGVNSNGIPVYINSSGQLGTYSSSRRYKEDIQDMSDASSGLMRLRIALRKSRPTSIPATSMNTEASPNSFTKSSNKRPASPSESFRR